MFFFLVYWTKLYLCGNIRSGGRMVRFCGCGAKVDHIDLFVPPLTRVAQISGKPSIIHLEEADLYSGEVTCEECAPFLMMMGHKFVPFSTARRKLYSAKWYHRKQKRKEFFGIMEVNQEVEQVSV